MMKVANPGNSVSKSGNSPIYKLLTYKPEFKSERTRRLVNAGMTVTFGLMTTSTFLSLEKLKLKDVLKYNTLNAVQKSKVKTTCLYGLLSSLLFGFHGTQIFKTKNKSNNGENNIESQSKDNNAQLSFEA